MPPNKGHCCNKKEKLPKIPCEGSFATPMLEKQSKTSFILSRLKWLIQIVFV
jgi:hypothetical protein